MKAQHVLTSRNLLIILDVFAVFLHCERMDIHPMLICFYLFCLRSIYIFADNCGAYRQNKVKLYLSINNLDCKPTGDLELSDTQKRSCPLKQSNILLSSPIDSHELERNRTDGFSCLKAEANMF